MVSKMVLRGPNASAGPFASSTTAIVRPRVWSTRLVSLTSGSGQHGLYRNQNTETYLWTSQTGPGHEHTRHPDHCWIHVQQRILKAAEHPALDLHAPPDHDYLTPDQSEGQECCDRVACSAFPQSSHPCVLPAVLSGGGINIDPEATAYYTHLHRHSGVRESGVRYSAQETVDLQSPRPEL